MEVVNSTSLAELMPALEMSFGFLGVPVSETHYIGLPYISYEWKKFQGRQSLSTAPARLSTHSGMVL